jgi:predicted DNA-binding ArsR family transcriptional regulator
MTPKEKAEELFEKFNNPDTTYHPYVHNAQQCALIAVDEILNVIIAIYDYDYEVLNPYWNEVKQELEKL